MYEWEEYLSDIYYNSSKPASFSGPDKLYEYIQRDGKYDISKYKIRKWLQRQEPYSFQRPMRKTFPRNQIFVTGIDDHWSADLMDMMKFKQYNDGYSYILMVIDVFSKYLWMRPLKTKTGESVKSALANILREGRSPTRIRTDKGQEFKAREVQKLLNKYNIQHLYAQNETKATVAERVIKTIKSKMYRYFTYKQSYRYVDELQNFVDSYNNTYHRTIKMPPNEVDKADETRVWWTMYWPKHLIRTKKRFRFNVGDRVRISHLSNIFTREYDDKWTGEIFIITRRYLRGGLPIYKIKDYHDDDIQGTFYQSELQKVDVQNEDLWKVEEILKTRGKGRKKQYYVKWLQWPKKFNSWLNASDVKNL